MNTFTARYLPCYLIPPMAGWRLRLTGSRTRGRREAHGV